MIFNMCNIPNETKRMTFYVSDIITTDSYTINNVETPTGSIRGFVLVRNGSSPLISDSISFALAFPNVDSSGNFRYLRYAYVSNTGWYLSLYDTASLTGQGYVYDSSAKTLTLNVFHDTKIQAGNYELYTW